LLPITIVTRPTLPVRSSSTVTSTWVLPPASGSHACSASRSAEVAPLQATLTSPRPDCLATIWAKLSPVPFGPSPVA
jgi:hypothetical protein